MYKIKTDSGYFHTNGGYMASIINDESTADILCESHAEYVVAFLLRAGYKNLHMVLVDGTCKECNRERAQFSKL